jgi:phosphatidylserine/phosphatidylglycerophosphate/cardiolipin synthase-like enzyme
VRLSTTLFSLLLLGTTSASSQTITALEVPSAIADGGGSGTTGTPYAVLVRIEGWTAAANTQAYVKIYSGTNNEYLWSATGVWSNATAFAATNQPIANLDAGGNWTGWIYAKHNSNVGVATSLRAAQVGNTSARVTGALPNFSVLIMSISGNGGWITRASSPAVNKAILAYSAGGVVGSYRTEDNGITEGYASTAGGFKIAVPAGFVDSLVTLNDDGSRDRVFIGPWMVAPGSETDASEPGGSAGPGSAWVLPSILRGGLSTAIALRVSGDTAAMVQAISFIIPPRWIWSGQLADVEISSPGAPVAALVGDSLRITGVALGPADTASITIRQLIPQDTTAYVSLMVATGTQADSVFPLRTLPVLFLHGTPLDIASAKENDANGVMIRINSWITVRGIVTASDQFGPASYLQDNSGGLTVYGTSFSSSVQVGDEVIVSGLVQPFSGLSEIVNPVLDSVLSHGNTVDPLVVTAAQIAGDGVGGVEQYECRLVRVTGVTVPGVATWSAGTNYTLNDASGSTQIRIDKNTNLPGTPVPASQFDVIGVVGQFVNQSPYLGGYQLLPRSTADLFSSGPIIAVSPHEVDIRPTGLDIAWRTLNPGTTQARYGITRALEQGTVGNDQPSLDHRVSIGGLSPATVYYIQAFSVGGGDTSYAQILVASTSSPAEASGEIHVYFNKSVDTSVAWSEPANGNEDLVSLITARIDAAQRSVDAALYSLSGTPGPGTDIANALVRAKNRGVHVRMICEADNRNTSPWNLIAANGIPLISDTFDPVNNGAGLMHNKFFLFDARGGAPESVWVWTGSWNPTDPGTNNDYQNVIEIQDPALAGAYLLEFNEMWGSSTDTPDGSASRFGARKTDNTPHRFLIAGRPVECYFSPSDRTTSHILDCIDSAKHSIAFALLTLTRSDLAAGLVSRRVAGVKVRGILDDDSDTGSQYGALVGGGVDVLLKSGPGSSGYLFHHKYSILDAEDPAWDPVTITGSHNWTNAAENSNNENTVIVHDAAIANQYLQEFAARYVQYGGTDTITVSVNGEAGGYPLSTHLEQNYPNPFNPSTSVRFSLSRASRVVLRVYDVLGREVKTLIDASLAAGNYVARFDGMSLASGLYVVRLTAGSIVEQRKMLLLR